MHLARRGLLCPNEFRRAQKRCRPCQGYLTFFEHAIYMIVALNTVALVLVFDSLVH